MNQNEDIFIYARPKTTDIKDNDLVYTLDYTPYRLCRKSFLTPVDKIDKKIKAFFGANRVFYQSNEIGEIIHNYLLSCTRQ